MRINGSCPRLGSGLGKVVLGLMDDSGLGQEEQEVSCSRSAQIGGTGCPQLWGES